MNHPAHMPADEFGRAMTSSQITLNLQGYWEDYAAAFKKPMTSLRDVDEAGVIRASHIDPGGTEHSRFVRLEDVTRVMRAIRGQKGDAAETDGEGTETDEADRPEATRHPLDSHSVRLHASSLVLASLIHSLADASGLDRDGIGEYIFPADLAFTIYRKGMTPDLGNISAMWRNHAMDFLRRSVEPRMLRCGSGSLCDSRGGACPACIMVSDVTCMASNLLLSRSALKGGPRPEWEDVGSSDIIGYFDRRLDA